MRAFEIIGKISKDGSLELPKSSLAQLKPNERVRVIVLTQESGEEAEEAAWDRIANKQFLMQFDDGDSIYDRL